MPPSWFNFFDFHAVFSEKFGQTIGWHPFLGLVLLIWEILDPPLHLLAHIQVCHFLKTCDKRVWPLLQASILNGGAMVVIFEVFGNSCHPKWLVDPESLR